MKTRIMLAIAMLALAVLACGGEYDYDASIQRTPPRQPAIEYDWNGRDFVPRK